MKVIKFYDDGWRIALLVGTGRKWCRLIPLDSGGLRVIRRPEEQETEFKYPDYPLDQAVSRFLDFGRQCGMTKEVEGLLRAA